MKIRAVDNSNGESPDYVFFCEPCGCGHGIWTTKPNQIIGGKWTFDGNMDSPTISPSILINESGKVCHSFVRGGMIQYLGDCTHELKGQTVSLRDF